MDSIVPASALQQHVAVLGKTRSGKSSVMRGIVEGLLDKELPVCIIDPKGDWWGIKLNKDGKRAGYPVVIFGGPHADVPINAHAGSHIAELFATGNRPCLIDLGGWMVGERTRFYIDFASTLFRLTRGMRWLVIDEIHNFAPKGKIMDPDAGKALHWTNRLASEGLGKGVPMLFASQRPQKVHNDTLTSAETLIAMRVLHPSDRGAVADWIKGCGDMELGNKVLNSLAQMDRGEGWLWSPEIGLGPKRVKFPMFHTYDSFRPQSAEDTASLKGWATVDLDDVKAKLAAVVKEAEANDPKALKAEIARLGQELKRTHKAAPQRPAIDEAHLNKVYEQNREYERQVKTLRTHIGVLGKILSRAYTQSKSIADMLVVIPTLDDKPVLIAQSRQEMEPYLKSLAKLPEKTKRDLIEGSWNGSGNGELAPGQRRIVNALAELHLIGVAEPNRTQTGLFAGRDLTGGKGGQDVADLVKIGYAEIPRTGTVRLTADGHAQASIDHAPESRHALHQRVMTRLSDGKRRILEHLIQEHPTHLSRRELGAAIGRDLTGGKGGQDVADLIGMGVVDIPSTGAVVASDLLFPHGLS